MRPLGILAALFVVVSFTQAVPPPLLPPAIRVEVTGKADEAPKLLQVFAGDFYRVDYVASANTQMVQIWWSKAEWKQFTDFLAKNKLANKGKVVVASASPEGAQLEAYIQANVVVPAAAKANRILAEQLKLQKLKEKDRNP